jgi:esterase/lipase
MAPVGGNAAFCRHPCTGKKDDVLILLRINGFHVLKPQGRDYHDHSCLTITITKLQSWLSRYIAEYQMKCGIIGG